MSHNDFYKNGCKNTDLPMNVCGYSMKKRCWQFLFDYLDFLSQFHCLK